MKKTNIELQYDEIRLTIPKDYLLFFQIGDFFELFNEDAVKIHNATGITLTKRGTMPMAGVPCRNVMFYIKKLVFEHNYTAAICEQTEMINGKIMQRKVTKICTQGTIYDELSPEYNMVMSIYIDNKFAYITYGDISTNDFFIENVEIDDISSYISKIKPIKIISNNHIETTDCVVEIINIDNINSYKSDITVTSYEQISFNILMDFFNNKGYKITPYIYKQAEKYMYLHANTLKHLDIFSDINGNTQNSLFAIINKTQTGMGYRLLQQHIKFPSTNIEYLREYLNNVEKFINYKPLIFNIGDIPRNMNNITNIQNIQRLAINIQNSKKLIESCRSILPKKLLDLYNQIQNINIDNYLLNLFKNDSFINSPQIIELQEEFQQILKKMEELPKILGINAVFERNSLIGAFFKTNEIIYNKEFLPKKGLKDSFRYTHFSLIEYENKLLSIEEEIEIIKNKILEDIINYINNYKNDINILSNIIAEIDVLHSKAAIAKEYDLKMPIFTDKNKQIKIKDGYNLIIKARNSVCINNNFELNQQKTMILTGINMGGKSTYLKQNAINVLMAHAGMYTAGDCELSIITGLFVRMGAYDDIFNGASTFFMEMSECAMFLKTANQDSLIILDEIGRGTSYKEGICISQAICEYIQKINSFCIISTHYLELPKKIDNIICKQVSYQNNNDKITFLYKIIDGIAQTSLSINVIKETKMPNEIYLRAKELINF